MYLIHLHIALITFEENLKANGNQNTIPNWLLAVLERLLELGVELENDGETAP